MLSALARVCHAAPALEGWDPEPVRDDEDEQEQHQLRGAPCRVIDNGLRHLGEIVWGEELMRVPAPGA